MQARRTWNVLKGVWHSNFLDGHHRSHRPAPSAQPRFHPCPVCLVEPSYFDPIVVCETSHLSQILSPPNHYRLVMFPV